MMKRMLLLLTVLLLLCGAALADDMPLRIMTASDLHFIAPALYQDSALFEQALATGDGKAAMYSAELLEAFMAEVRHQAPDLLVLSGDLTFNGELESHRVLSDAMRTLSQEGIRVAVIPGNHDVNTGSAMRYLPYSWEKAEDTTPEQFAALWQGLTADAFPGPGSSGVVQLPGNVWVVLGDYSVYDPVNASNGLLTQAHRTWLDEVTAAAREAGAQLISVSHQSMIPHTTYSAETYAIWLGEDAMRVLADAGCVLNLSGHMHIQHVLSGTVMTDIATGAWCMTPHRYAMVTVADGRVTYEARAVCPEHAAAGILEASHAFYRRTAEAKLRRSFAEAPDEAALADMVSYAADVNEAYFAGTLSQHPEYFDDARRSRWEEGSSFSRYMTTLLAEAPADCLHWQSP